MFPIPWNFPFRKKNGDMSTIGAEIGGAGSELPPHSSSDAGKLLGVKPNGSLEWSDTVNSEIQTLTNKLNGEIETRAKVSAHNFLIFNKANVIAGNSSGTWSSNVYTINGGTITLSDVGEIVVNGTFTAQTDFTYTKRTTSDLILTPGDYKLVGGINDNISVAGNTTRNGAYNNLGSDTGDGLPFTITSDDAGVGIFVRVLAGTYDNVKVSPMITAPNDFASAFTPYAMTNRELTEVAQHIEGKYVVVAVNNYVQVTANGVKTAKELLNDLASAYIAMTQALEDDEATSVTGGNVYVPTASGASAFPSITTFSRKLNTNSNTSDINVIFRGILLDTAKLMTVNVKVHSTLSSCEMKGYDLLNSNSAFDDSDTVVPNGKIISLYYSLYQRAQ